MFVVLYLHVGILVTSLEMSVTARKHKKAFTGGARDTQCAAGALGEKPEGRKPRASVAAARRGGFGKLGCVARRARWAEHFAPKMPRPKLPPKRLSTAAWVASQEKRAALQEGERRAHPPCAQSAPRAKRALLLLFFRMLFSTARRFRQTMRA